MKTISHLFAFIAVVTLCTSCSLLTSVLASPSTSPDGAPVKSLPVHLPKSLTLTQDPGTGLYGYVDEFGRWAIAPQFRNAYNFNKDVGIAVVELSHGHYGGINTLGQIVIKPNFTSSYDVHSAIDSIEKGRYCGVDLWEVEDRTTELWGYLNHHGEWHIAPQYGYASDFNTDAGIAVVEVSNGYYGGINTLGQIVIKPNFTSTYDVHGAISSILKGRYAGIDLWEEKDPATGLWGYLNYYGEWHIQPQFTYAQSMDSDGYAVVEFSERRWGAINRNGQVVLQPNFNSSYDAQSALHRLTR